MTKIKRYFTFLLLICSASIYGQHTHLDSLKQKLAVAKADTIKIDLSNEISSAYSNTNYDSMVFYAKKTIQLLHHVLAKETVDSVKLNKIGQICVLYQYVNNDSAIHYAQQALLFVIKHKNNFPVGYEAWALSGLAYTLWWAGNYPEAKETYFKALQKAEPLGDTMMIGIIYNGIATVSRNAGDYREAINYYTKAENLTKHIPDNDVLYDGLADKGKSYEQLGILDSAYIYVQESLAMMGRKYKGKNVGGGIHAIMGTIYSKMGKEQLAVEFFRQSFQLNKEVNEIRLLARGYCEYAEHFDRFHHLDSAIYYASKGFLIDQQFNFLVYQLQAATLLTKLYKQENKIDSAFKYQQYMVDLREQVFSNEKVNRLHTLEFNEQLRQQELALEKEKLDEERKENIQYALIAIALISMIILFLFLGLHVITNPKVISFFGVIALLLVFEFLNLLMHPLLENITHHSPALMLLSLVAIAAIIVPLHHRLEHSATHKLVEKNKAIRLAKAKKTIEELEEKKDNMNKSSRNDLHEEK